jgi:hypothetical protein
MRGLVAALRAADGPRAADVVRLRHDFVVLPFAEGDADGMDRRQVQHVEAHPRDARELRLDVPERAVTSLVRRRRPREQLVPRAVRRARRIDLDAQLAVIRRHEPALGVAPHQLEQVFAAKVLDLLLERIVALDRVDEGLQLALVARAGPLRRRAKVLEPDPQLDAQFFFARAAVDALLHVAVPRQEVVDPRVDGEAVEAEAVDNEVGGPAVVDERPHPHFAPLRIILVTMQDDRGDEVVAVGEDVRLRRHNVPRDTLRRVRAAIDLRRRRFDDDSLSSVQLQLRSNHSTRKC